MPTTSSNSTKSIQFSVRTGRQRVSNLRHQSGTHVAHACISPLKVLTTFRCRCCTTATCVPSQRRQSSVSLHARRKRWRRNGRCATRVILYCLLVEQLRKPSVVTPTYEPFAVSELCTADDQPCPSHAGCESTGRGTDRPPTLSRMTSCGPDRVTVVDRLRLRLRPRRSDWQKRRRQRARGRRKRAEAEVARVGGRNGVVNKRHLPLRSHNRAGHSCSFGTQSPNWRHVSLDSQSQHSVGIHLHTRISRVAWTRSDAAPRSRSMRVTVKTRGDGAQCTTLPVNDSRR